MQPSRARRVAAFRVRRPDAARIAGGALIAIGALGAPLARGQCWLSEVLVNPPGTDNGFEAVEIQGPPSRSLDGWWLLVLEGDGVAGGGPAGIIDVRLSLTGLATGTTGLLLIRDSATVIQPPPSQGTTVAVIDFVPDLENGSATYLLGTGTPPTLGTDLDANDDGTLDAGALPNFTVVDSVSYIENDGPNNFQYAGDFQGAEFGPFASFNPDGIYRTLTVDFLPGPWAGGDVLGTPPGPFTWDWANRRTFGWGSNGLPDGNRELSPGRLNWPAAAPVITDQPDDAEACLGSSARFEVVATGVPSPTFQWRRGTTDLAGATGPVLVLDKVLAEDEGSYTVVIRNVVGSVTSAAATLTVTDPPLWYRDADGDGFGDPGAAVPSCTMPKGYVANDDDCDDADESIYPGAVEACDGVDNDCDDAIDEGCPRRILVDADATGRNNGTSWADAYTSVQGALADAVAGDEIWIAAGRYRPTAGTDRGATFALKDKVRVFGGFAGTETSRGQRDWSRHASILSGEIGASDSTADNSLHVVTASGVGPETLLDGVVIERGRADGGGGASSGGGVRIVGAHPVIQHCRVLACRAAERGGGIWADSASAPVITSCALTGNSAGISGGAIALAGAGALSASTVAGNTADLVAGGVYVTSSGARVSGCVLWGNGAPFGTTENDQYVADGVPPSAVYSIVQGLQSGLGEGTTGGDPNLADPDGPDNIAGTLDDDLRILAPSAAVDAGDTPGLPPDAFDLDGDGDVAEPALFDLAAGPRRLDLNTVPDTGRGPAPIPDIGAFEIVCGADFNADGRIDSDDFFDFLNAFNASDPSADFNRDGAVDSDDFFDFLNAFNAGC